MTTIRMEGTTYERVFPLDPGFAEIDVVLGEFPVPGGGVRVDVKKYFWRGNLYDPVWIDRIFYKQYKDVLPWDLEVVKFDYNRMQYKAYRKDSNNRAIIKFTEDCQNLVSWVKLNVRPRILDTLAIWSIIKPRQPGERW